MSDGGAGCKAYKQAIMDIGHAFHAISDSYSPSHSFEHWGGLGKSLITGDAVKHVRRETLKAWLKSSPEFRQEVIDALTSRLLDALDQALSGCRSMDGTK